MVKGKFCGILVLSIVFKKQFFVFSDNDTYLGIGNAVLVLCTAVSAAGCNAAPLQAAGRLSALAAFA